MKLLRKNLNRVETVHEVKLLSVPAFKIFEKKPLTVHVKEIKDNDQMPQLEIIQSQETVLTEEKLYL